MRFSWIALWVAVAGAAAVPCAQAIPPMVPAHTNALDITNEGYRYQPQRPTISPYLALSPTTWGTFGLLNYYVIVKPQIQQRAINSYQDQEIRQLQQNVATPDARYAPSGAGVRPTGNFAWYMNHERYFGGPPITATGGAPTAATSRTVPTAAVPYGR